MNPNFKRITPELLKASEKQVQKYFGEIEMDDKCEFCKAVGRDNWGLALCEKCPLSGGDAYGYDCLDDPTYIAQNERKTAPKEKLLARGYRLIEILKKHWIEIKDVEVE